MATLTPTLSLVSTDLSSDELNFSVTDSLTIKAPAQGISTFIANSGTTDPDVGANNIIVPPTGGVVTYFYCRHTGLTGSGTATSTALVDVEETGNEPFARLGAGEWMYLPFCHNAGNVGIQFQVAAATAVLMEYAFFTKG